jgi:hypothetical protein
VHDDLHRVAGPLGEVGLEGVGDVLRLGARLEVVLLELPTERAGECEAPDQGGDPAQDHETTLLEAPISETYEHRDSSGREGGGAVDARKGGAAARWGGQHDKGG